MRAWVAGFDWGRFNASRRQILPMLACEKPKIEEQAIVTWTGSETPGIAIDILSALGLGVLPKTAEPV